MATKKAPFRKKPLSVAVSGKEPEQYELLSKDEDIKETLLEKKVFWEDLDGLYQELMASLLKFMAPLSQIVRDDGIISKVKDVAYFNKLITTVTNDGNHYRAQLEGIRNMHSSRKGQITDMEQYELYTDLFAQYTTVSTTMISTMAPLTTELILIINEDAEDAARSVEEKDITPKKH